MFSADDHKFMARAVTLARRGWNTTHPNPRVGCVIVNGNEIVGEGFHAVAGEAHAEVRALAMAGESARGATAYVTLEPCSHHGRTPPCADALLRAGLARVVAAMTDPNPLVAGQGLDRLRAEGIRVEEGLSGFAARELNPGFIQRMTTGRPRVRVKLAASLDGRTAMASGESQWITGEAARADVQRLRAESSALLTGVGTVLADDPRMDVRLPGTFRQPERIVLDTELRTPAVAKLLLLPGTVRIFTCSNDAARRAPLEAAGAVIETVPDDDAGSLLLEAVLARLGELKHNDVLVEAGARLAGQFLDRGLADELIVYQAPVLLGHEGRPLAELPGLERLAERLEFRLRDVRQVGDDLRLTLVRKT
ncbi:MAG TPA: bifunctional diaminohydroxyphosphoribosylaminopyrimidine deaminase/5-amino-6-(5-phosphoribosylamino)uracil reductase RibD [Gammaproteobacteria bacterium]